MRTIKRRRRIAMRAGALVLVVAAVATGCGRKSHPGLLDPGAMLYINVVDATTTNRMDITNNTPKALDADETTDEKPAEQKLMTPREIVEKSANFVFRDGNGNEGSRFTVSDWMRDYENERIKVWGQMIIREDGTLNETFINARNVYIEPQRGDLEGGDVIAYIPNKTMEEGARKIRKAYKEGKYEEVYRLFQEVYTAIPITEKEYLRLKAEGRN